MSVRRGPTLFNRASVALGLAFLYAPIALLMLYSFNASRLVTVWGGFSTRWYAALVQDAQMLDAVWVTLRVGLISATVATALAVLAAVALVRGGRFRGRALFSGMIYAPLVMPEVILGLSLLLFSNLEPPGPGDAVAVLSGVFYAGLMLLLRKERGVSADAAVMMGNAAAAGVLLPVVLATTGIGLSLPSALILGWLGMVQIGIAVVLLTRGLRWVGAAPAALVGMLEPVANPIWVLLALGEVPSVASIVGGATVIAAVAWRTMATPVTTQMLPPE